MAVLAMEMSCVSENFSFLTVGIYSENCKLSCQQLIVLLPVHVVRMRLGPGQYDRYSLRVFNTSE